MSSNIVQTPPISPKSASTTITTPDKDEILENDIWDNSPSPTLRTTSSEIISDLPAIRRQHMTDGYREGLAIGKARVMQTGFDSGYPLGLSYALRIGKLLGVLEGVIGCKGVVEREMSEIQKMYKTAKQELSIARLLYGVTDEQVMNDGELKSSMETVVNKWEQVVFGKTEVG
ncbi:hypothetical protein BT93_L0117 [Corymbia citriodora subsp. variegata]|uniref:Essential protein Yae1 N-terminal domain-containing protein n=1 Tax=Corymbia citriodora subsp. variegata TaxID=360336 RepID=A0A8T0CIG2_CORYI|nr:hypothetical protein BT93_L0117 [Corymbia citriodora subsp. variegata]